MDTRLRENKLKHEGLAEEEIKLETEKRQEERESVWFNTWKQYYENIGIDIYTSDGKIKCLQEILKEENERYMKKLEQNANEKMEILKQKNKSKKYKKKYFYQD